MQHKSDGADAQGQLWHPVRAIASTKVHDYPKLVRDWEKQFDKKNTAKDKFFLPSGEGVMADMMVQ